MPIFIYDLRAHWLVATAEQISNIIMFRGLGFSQMEISEAVDLSRQTVAYQLKKLKKEALLYGSKDVFAKKTGMQQADSKDLREALLMIEILRDEEKSGDIVVVDENIRQVITSFLNHDDWVTLPEIHFYLARTFLGFNGSPSGWEKGWPSQLSNRLGWSKSLSDEIQEICGDNIEIKGLGKSIVTKARLAIEA